MFMNHSKVTRSFSAELLSDDHSFVTRTNGFNSHLSVEYSTPKLILIRFIRRIPRQKLDR
jgi:hypothetical protein